MILYCYRDGVLGVARDLPVGAFELARGGRDSIRAALAACGRLLQGRSGTSSWHTIAARDEDIFAFLRGVLKRLDVVDVPGVTWNLALDARFVGQG